MSQLELAQSVKDSSNCQVKIRDEIINRMDVLNPQRRDRSTEVGLSTKKRGEFEGNHWKWPLIMTGAILEISSCSQPIQVNGSSTLTLHPTLCLTRSWIQATYAW
ncbi:uncharacterized protein LOC133031111 isoform X4 [Cannabis sativa]|uniref:uncharacterized protein LOC133031111 isoform X4 n=1 Tax=Cannabis sativa TaxID=3483 RepID=UPI0029CA48DE|nr:uncharacterized protein LOC133031111 isoform X4 [Cannabis sativa]